MLISEIAVRRPVFTTMVIGALVVFGVVSLSRLGVDLFPRVDFPVITIVTQLPGADPETMETRVTDIIEEAVNTLASIKRLRSTSADSYSLIAIEFELEKDVDVAFQEVQARVNSIRTQLPLDIEEPVVEKFDVDAEPILTVVVSADMGIRELSHLADKVIKERLQRVRDVGSARIVGRRDRKIWLWLDPVKLRQHNLTVRDVRAALQAQHLEAPGGRVETGPLELVTRTKAEFASAAEMNGLILASRAGSTVRLADVGYAEDGLEEERSAAQLDGRPCIAIQVRRQSGANTVQVAHDVKAEVARLQEELKSEGVRLVVSVDLSTFIEQSVNEVKHHLLVGGLMAIVSVLIFLLNFRSTFISALVLPTSILSTFMMLNALGFTLNMMTLMALTLAIGLLIDDAIVVQENIMRHVEAGKPARAAALFATNEIGLAVLATTLSVVAVFVPVAFTRGIVGRFFWPFGLTISFAVLVSMFVSFTLDPMLSSRLLRKRAELFFLFRWLEAGFRGLEWLYEKLLGWSLRWRLVVVVLGLASLGSLVGLGRDLKQEFVPVEDRSEFNVMVRAPQGASLDRTREIINRIREKLKTIPEIRYTFTAIGADQLQKVNEGVVYVRLKEKRERTRTQTELMQLARGLLADVRDAQVSVQMVAFVSGGGFKWAQIQCEVRGAEQPVLLELSGRILDILGRKVTIHTPDGRTLPGELVREDGQERVVRVVGPTLLSGEKGEQRVTAAQVTHDYVDLQTSYETGKPEADVLINRARAAELGVAPADVADSLRAAIGGTTIGKFKDGSDRYDIDVRFLERYRDRPDLIADLWVPSRNGGLVELRNVANVVKTDIPVEITRYNRERNITVLANLGPGKVLGPAHGEINALVKPGADPATGAATPPLVPLPPGYALGWAGQTQDMEESFGYLYETMLLSVIVVYMVLAAQFESFIHPFTIMLSLPLAFIGALAGLLMLHAAVSIFVMIAFIFLLGLVTKNAILLIDYTNTLRERDGLDREAALRKAGPVRLRPILMTTFAMICGMLPSALGTGEGAESRQPMAVAIIGGLVTSTALTLLVVPAVYSFFDQFTEWLRARLGLAARSAVRRHKETEQLSD